MKDLPLILLHGWGFSSRIWQPLIHALHDTGITRVFAIDLPGFGAAFHEPCKNLDSILENVLENIAVQLPEKCVLGGWSLGGMLAVQIAARHPDRIAGLITIGSNLHFTATDHWPGMPPDDYMQFCQRFDNQPEKTWQRFLGLQTRGDSHVEHANALLTELADFQDCNTDTAVHMLRLLGEMDNRTLFPALAVRSLHLFGEVDAITPVAVIDYLPGTHASQRIEVLRGCSHAIPVSRAVEVATHIQQFLASTPDVSPKKSHIARSFSRAAQTYNQAAQLQKTVGEALLSTLPSAMEGVALDLGCGTGFISSALKKNNNALDVFSVDIASGMLQIAHSEKQLQCVQADMEALPFASQSADWLLSSLALQWSDNPVRCFAEWQRVLKPTGVLFFTTFLPGTLQELKNSWLSVDDDIHVNTFLTQETIVTALQRAGFTHIETQTAIHTLYYPHLHDLARELKAIGAHNMNASRRQGLTGKTRWQKMHAVYESLRTKHGLPATYEVLYVSAR